LRTKSRIRFKKLERVQRHASQRILHLLTWDQRKILMLAADGYTPGEIGRELAMEPDYVRDFMVGMVQKLVQDRVIPSPEWRCVLEWADQEGLL
jgi:DNA-binding NarL/FixJ family response regulator